MARRCVRRSLSNYFDMASYHWNVRQNTVTWRWWMNGKNNETSFTKWQYFVSGRACCVNQYHYESRKWRVVMRLVHATDKTWYKVLYQHTMYVISLSNISIIYWSLKKLTREYWYSDSNLRPFFSYKKATKNHI
jgi:hypothetical protein